MKQEFYLVEYKTVFQQVFDIWDNDIAIFVSFIERQFGLFTLLNN